MEQSCKGVFVTQKKNGQLSFRTSLTYRNKHIALGSFDSMDVASRVYSEGLEILANTDIAIENYSSAYAISFEKFVILINFRDSGLYCSNPLVVRKNYISYYFSVDEEYKFSKDDLFYYASHKILRRGNHLYVNDYGMQLSLGSRYGIKGYAVEGRDYRFVNGDNTDYRYENIEILNMYNGVEYVEGPRKSGYRVKIHVVGDLIVGYYDDVIKAAIAYNKAIDILKKNGITRDFNANYIEDINGKVYAQIYSEVEINDCIYNRRG